MLSISEILFVYLCVCYAIYTFTAMLDTQFLCRYVSGVLKVHRNFFKVPVLLNFSTFFGIMSFIVFPNVLPKMNVLAFCVSYFVIAVLISSYTRYRECMLIDQGKIHITESNALMNFIFTVALYMCFFLDCTVFKFLHGYNSLYYALILACIYIVFCNYKIVDQLYDSLTYVLSGSLIITLLYMAFHTVPFSFVHYGSSGVSSVIYAIYLALWFNTQSFDVFTIITQLNTVHVNDTYGKQYANKSDIFAATAFTAGLLNFCVNGVTVLFGYYLKQKLGYTLSEHARLLYPICFYIMCALLSVNFVSIVKNFMLCCSIYNLERSYILCLVVFFIVSQAIVLQYFGDYSDMLTLASYAFLQVFIGVRVLYGSIKSLRQR